MNDVNKPVALVTARGGSKRIPNKNIRLMHGKPLISWTLEILLHSDKFSRVIVTTDSEEIAKISRGVGAETPFMRPPELANDLASTAEVASHAIDWLIDHGTPRKTIFCTVYPAAIFTKISDYDRSLELMQRERLEMVFAGCEFPSPPSRGWLLDGDHVALALDDEKQLLRSQDVPATFYDAGQFYWSQSETWRRILSGEPVRRGLYKMSRSQVVDIDTEEDWELAERIFFPSELRGVGHND